MKYILPLTIILLVLGSILVYKSDTGNRKISQTITKIEEVRETIAPKPSTITSSGLPDKHLINTAFVPQAPEKNWNQPWQDACEEASLLTVNYYYMNTRPSLSEILTDYQSIFSYEEDNGWSHDVNLEEMSQIATNKFNLKANIITDPSILTIKDYISSDIPVIITANGKTLYQENKHFKSGGPWYHSLVILGYDDNIGKFIVHDVGTQFGSYFKYSYDLLMQSIHDLPENRDKQEIDTGNKKILVLLQ